RRFPYTPLFRSVGQPGGQVLERVHRHVDAPLEQRRLDLFREEALPFELLQGAVDLGVATRLDNHDLSRHPPFGEPLAHPSRLPQRQLAPTRPELEDATHPSLRPPGSPLRSPLPPSPHP